MLHTAFPPFPILGYNAVVPQDKSNTLFASQTMMFKNQRRNKINKRLDSLSLIRRCSVHPQLASMRRSDREPKHYNAQIVAEAPDG